MWLTLTFYDVTYNFLKVVGYFLTSILSKGIDFWQYTGSKSKFPIQNASCIFYICCYCDVQWGKNSKYYVCSKFCVTHQCLVIWSTNIWGYASWPVCVSVSPLPPCWDFFPFLSHTAHQQALLHIITRVYLPVKHLHVKILLNKLIVYFKCQTTKLM